MRDRIRLFAIIASLTLFLTVLTSSAHAAVYAWKGENGVMNFSDDPTKAPAGIKVEVRNYGTGTAAQTAGERPANAVTQGEFVRQLAIELGLAKKDLDAEQAAQLLARLRIAPPLGRWALDQPLTNDLLQRLRKLTAAAAVGGTIVLTPEEALYAFDSAADLVGVAIRERPAREAEQAPVTAEQAPVPVYVVPSAPPVVEERVIFVGGCCADGLVRQAPIVVHKKIINVQKVIINKQVSPRPTPPPARVIAPGPRHDHPPVRFVPMPVSVRASADMPAGTVESTSGLMRVMPGSGVALPLMQGIVTPGVTQATGGASMRARAMR